MADADSTFDEEGDESMFEGDCYSPPESPETQVENGGTGAEIPIGLIAVRGHTPHDFEPLARNHRGRRQQREREIVANAIYDGRKENLDW